eukprot:m.86243 g.86243  ORF g.86243 m.86243 type:complete len:494 (-) comp13049_c0_seq1:13-1494(-)
MMFAINFLSFLLIQSSNNHISKLSSVSWPWTPPPADGPNLLSFLRNTSRPKLAYSTWVGWYLDGGLNESVLWNQVNTMATVLRPHGWTHILHDYGWQVCGDTNNPTMGCIHIDNYGRLLPSPKRYPSTIANSSWKPFVDKTHTAGIAYGLHRMIGIPKQAVNQKLPIFNSSFTADEIVATPLCASFIPDHWAINVTHPGAQLYYDSVVTHWASEEIDFIYFDGVIGECGYCHIGEAALLADSLRRLGNGMFMYISAGPPDASQCPFEALTDIAPYVRVGADTIDSWKGAVLNGFSEYTRLTAPSVRPHHFGDLASLMVGKVHCKQGHPNCSPGPDYYIPSNTSSMNEAEVYSYASMVAMFRSTWWPSGALSDMDDFNRALLTNDEVIMLTMASHGTRQVLDIVGNSFAGPGIVWVSYSDVSDMVYVFLVNIDDEKQQLVGAKFIELGLAPEDKCVVIDLWNKTTLTTASGVISATLAPHSSLLLSLSNCSHSF